jgi:hypothetical protein
LRASRNQAFVAHAQRPRIWSAVPRPASRLSVSPDAHYPPITLSMSVHGKTAEGKRCGVWRMEHGKAKSAE